MKQVLVGIVIVLAALGLYFGAGIAVAEVQAYRQMKIEHVAMLRFLGETVASRKDDAGKDVPVTRADVLNVAVAKVLKDAQAQPAVASPVK